MRKFLIPTLIFLLGSTAVFAQEVDPNTDNVAGIPIPAGNGRPPKQDINLQAHLKASASTTFGVDLDTAYTGFKNEAKASVDLKFLNHEGWVWSNGQEGSGVKNANKGIRGGIVVQDFKLSNGHGLALTGSNKYVAKLPYYDANQHAAAAPAWSLIPDGTPGYDPTTMTYTPPGQPNIYNVFIRDIPVGQTNITDSKNQLFTVSYGGIVAYLYAHDFYIQVSTNPSIKSDNTVRFWSIPTVGLTSKFYGRPLGYFYGLDNFVGRRYRNTFGGFQVGYQKDDMFNVNAEIASMSHFDRNDGAQWGMKWMNAYAYKFSAAMLAVKNLNVAVNMTGAAGDTDWKSAPIGEDETHGLTPMVKDGRKGLLNIKGSNGAYTIGGKVSYKLPFSDFGWTNGHQMEFILGVDSIMDPFASENSLASNVLAKHNAGLDGSHGINTAVAVGAAVRYQWPIKDGVYKMKSDTSSDKTFLYEDGEDRHSGLTAGVSYSRALGFKRHDGQGNSADFNNFYNMGANALNFNISTFEDEESGLVPGLGWMFGFEVNDLLKNGYLGVSSATPYRTGFNLATVGELSYAFHGTWLSPKGRVIPYIGAWYSPNAHANTIKNQNFSDEYEQRLYTKVGVLLKQVIPFTEIGLKWESNNVLASKDKWGAISTTLKILYE